MMLKPMNNIGNSARHIRSIFWAANRLSNNATRDGRFLLSVSVRETVLDVLQSTISTALEAGGGITLVVVDRQRTSPSTRALIRNSSASVKLYARRQVCECKIETRFKCGRFICEKTKARREDEKETVT